MKKPIPSPPRARSAPLEGGRAAWIGLGALIAGLPWFYYRGWPTRDLMNDLKWPVAAGGLGVVMLCLIPLRGRVTETDGGSGKENLRILLAGAALIVSGLGISVLLSPARSLGIRTGLHEGMFVAACCALASVRLSDRTLKPLLALYLGSASLQAALTIWQWKFGLGTLQAPGRLAMVGTMGNPEYVAGWLAPATAISLTWLTQAGIRRRTSALLAVSTTVTGCSIILSGGRGAAIAVAAGTLCAWAMGRFCGMREKPADARPRRHWKASLITIVATLAGILALSALLSPEVRRQSLAGRIGEMFDPYSISVRHRVGLMIVTANMIAERPFAGSGPGRFAAAFDQTRGRLAREASSMGVWAFNDIQGDQPAMEAHCDWLQWWAEYGLLPFLGLLLMTGASLAALTEFRTDGENPIRLLLLAGLVALMVHMLFGFPLHRADRALLFWSLLAMGHAIRR